MRFQTVSNLIAELSFRTKWHDACCTWWAPDVLHVICTRLRPGHLSVRVGDSSQRTEEIVKNLDLRLSIDYYYHLHLHLHLGFVHPLQGVALHQCLPLSSVCCFPNPGGSLLLCYVILPSSAWSSSRPLPSPWLPLCASLCPPIVL